MAGWVTDTTAANLATGGADSDALSATSEGGGGGSAGAVIALTATTSTKPAALNIAVGGRGGNGAASGNVKVESSGKLSTAGDNAVGIRAESTGGGGGDGAITPAGTTRRNNRRDP